MKNKIFTMKPAGEKRRYLETVLKKGRSAAADDETIRRVMQIISIHKQYKVAMFTDNRVFRTAVARAQNGKALQTVLYSCQNDEMVAAVVAPMQSCGTQRIRRAIYVYAPNYRVRGCSPMRPGRIPT